MPQPFDSVIVVDWSAAASPSPARPAANAIWFGIVRHGHDEARYHRTRAAAEADLARLIDAERQAGRRLLLGFDFPFGYPQGFALRLTGRPGAAAVRDWLSRHLQDAPNNANNRFVLADGINRRFGGKGPFWGRPAALGLTDLPQKKPADYAVFGLDERRRVETLVPRAQPVWKLYTTGAAGSQTLTGLPVVHRIVARTGATVWPFDPPEGPLVLAEIYPSLIDVAVRRATAAIKDEAQVRLLARALHRLSIDGGLTALMAGVPDWPGRSDEGWILGAGHSQTLSGALA